MDILPLPEETRELLRSSIILPSIPSVVLELVQNSLDAGATSITVLIDLETFAVKVEDDGWGFTGDLKGLIGRNASSKQIGGGTAGFRGEALASVAQVATLEVMSQNEQGQNGHVLLRGGKELSTGSARSRGARGATVIARDIFYNVPVRRRPLTTPSGRTTLVNVLRPSLSALALLHPLVAFNCACSTPGGATTTLLSLQRTDGGTLGRWKQHWGSAGVEDVDYVRAELAVNGATAGQKLVVEGFISCSAVASRSKQFLFANGRHLLPSSEMHKAVNGLLEKSTFLSRASSTWAVPEPANLSASEDDADQRLSKRARTSPKKSGEKFAVWCLMISAPQEMVDVTFDIEKRVVEFETPEYFVTLLQDCVKSFLARRGCEPVPKARPAPPSNDIFSDPVEAPSSSSPARQLRPLNQAEPAVPSHRSRIDLGTLPIVCGTCHHDGPASDGEQENRDVGDAAIVRWVDPSMGLIHYLDQRTGSTVQHAPAQPTASAARLRVGVDRSALKRSLSPSAPVPSEVEAEASTSRHGAEGAITPRWIEARMSNWENPSFSALAAGSHRPPTALPGNASDAFVVAPTSGPERPGELDKFFSLSKAGVGLAGQLTLDRETLNKAEVISQVDNKFILCRLQPAGSDKDVLVVIDQHAASERIRVERFLDAVAGAVARQEDVAVHTFPEPVPVVLSREEAADLAIVNDELARWGVGVTLSELDKKSTEKDEDSYVQVYLRTVPSIVADRLRSEDRTRQSLLRSFLANAKGSSRSSKLPPNAGSSSWQSVLGECPSVLIELINSKACRGAIVFNDELSDEQCRDLISDLTKTSLPFQCAHGRPSMAPLVQLAQGTSRRRPAIDWSKW